MKTLKELSYHSDRNSSYIHSLEYTTSDVVLNGMNMRPPVSADAKDQGTAFFINNILQLKIKTSHHPYRAALGLDIALEEIERNKDILYDEDVAKGKGFYYKF
jgi:hypothetical protein